MHPYVSGPLQFSFIINRFDHSVSRNHLNRLSYYILLFKVFFLSRYICGCSSVRFSVSLDLSPLFGCRKKKKTVALSINMTFI